MTTQRSDLYALIIGINKYKDHHDMFPDLLGCVADAEAFKQYLQDSLGVPEGNITHLVDTKATRSRILQGFDDLATSSRIPKYSAICIFFAGHGATVEVPPGWEAGGRGRKIQAFVPHDCSENPESPIPAILDREVSILIDKICENKGNNITVIFDCCHSTSGTRNQSDEEHLGRVRCARRDISYLIHASAYDDTASNSVRSSTNIIPLGQIGLQSHVHLAACRSTEKTYETEHGSGRFSTALLSLLKKTDIEKLRYSDILKNLDHLPAQNPQCEGVHDNRYIFSATTPGKNKTLSLEVTEGDVITLAGGIANGVTRGAQFNVFSGTNSSSDNMIGRFVVDMPSLYESTGTMIIGAGTLKARQQYWAEQTKSGERTLLRIHSDPLLAETLYQDLQKTNPKFSNFDIVQRKSEAHIAIEKQDNDRVRLRVMDPTLDPTRQTANGYSCLMQNLGAIFEGISLYHWARDNGEVNVTLHQSVMSKVEVEFYKLKYHGRYATVRFAAVEPNLCEKYDDHRQVDLTISDNSDVYYGIKLINKSDYDLFPAIFYFDNDDLSICSYYQHPLPGPSSQPEILLPARKGSLTVGYGSGGAHPFSFNVPVGQDFDIGLVKIFLYTQPVNVSDFQQESPFDMTARKYKKWAPETAGLVWGVINIPVMQRREKNQTTTSTT